MSCRLTIAEATVSFALVGVRGIFAGFKDGEGVATCTDELGIQFAAKGHDPETAITRLMQAVSKQRAVERKALRDRTDQG